MLITISVKNSTVHIISIKKTPVLS